MVAGPEDRLTGWLRKKVALRGRDLIGDDAAFIDGDRLAVTVDQQIAGVHFVPELAPSAVGRRLVAVNVSDIAAVGGRPLFGLATLGAPPDYPIRALLAAVEKALADSGALLAGGDIAADARVHASLTLIAKRHARGRWVRRSSARAGDYLWVGGTLGESALGRVLIAAGARVDGGRIAIPKAAALTPTLTRPARRAVRRHLRPPNQLSLGAWLARRRRAAAIDISDGLLLDLQRLCRESGTGAVIDPESVPIANRALEIAEALEVDAHELALTGGEDYVLLFALPPSIVPPSAFGASRIGQVRRRPGIEVLGGRPAVADGWDHLNPD